jgi:hypothetical protein
LDKNKKSLACFSTGKAFCLGAITYTLAQVNIFTVLVDPAFGTLTVFSKTGGGIEPTTICTIDSVSSLDGFHFVFT